MCIWIERLFSTEDLLRSTRSEKERLLSEIQTIRQKMDKDEENRKIEFSHQIRSLELQLAHFRSENVRRYLEQSGVEDEKKRFLHL